MGIRATGLGAAAFLLGVLAAAWYGNEWMTMAVTGSPPFSLETMPEPDCDSDELEEEGLTLVECHQMALRVHHLSLSSPPWFPGFFKAIAASGLLLSLLSLPAAAALVDGRTRGPAAAAAVFAALCLVDAAAFAAVVMSGPLVRQVYLWSFVLWFALHLTLAAAAAALALPAQPAARPCPSTVE